MQIALKFFNQLEKFGSRGFLQKQEFILNLNLTGIARSNLQHSNRKLVNILSIFTNLTLFWALEHTCKFIT